MTKWTPGEWTVDVIHAGDKRAYIVDEADAPICSYDLDDPPFPREEVHANARLISAAPELYEALAALKAEPYGCVFCDSGKLRNPAKPHEDNCGYVLMEAALAKASPSQEEGE